MAAACSDGLQQAFAAQEAIHGVVELVNPASTQTRQAAMSARLGFTFPHLCHFQKGCK
jgi:hypothetical protein